MSIIMVSGPVIVEGRTVLVNKHGDTSFWKFCGGRAEASDKSLKEICLRKAKEEMGIDLEFLSEEPYFFYTKKETPEGSADVVLIHYLAKKVGGIKPSVEIREWAWLPIDRIENDELAPNIKPALMHFGLLA